jgi:hypothetical protein
VTDEWDDSGFTAPEQPKADETAAATDGSFERAVVGEGEEVVYSVQQTARTRELLARLGGARRSVTFYPRGHDVVRENISALMAAINSYHKEGVDVPLVFFDNEVLLGEQLLAAESVIFDQLIRDMSMSGETSVDFTQGLTLEELERAMQVLSADHATLGAGRARGGRRGRGHTSRADRYRRLRSRCGRLRVRDRPEQAGVVRRRARCGPQVR